MQEKTLLIILSAGIGVLVLGLAGLLLLTSGEAIDPPEPTEQTSVLEGPIIDIFQQSRDIAIDTADGRRFVSVTDITDIFDTNERARLFTDLELGITVQASGIFNEESVLLADQITIIVIPDIVIIAPTSGSIIAEEFFVTGEVAPHINRLFVDVYRSGEREAFHRVEYVVPEDFDGRRRFEVPVFLSLQDVNEPHDIRIHVYRLESEAEVTVRFEPRGVLSLYANPRLAISFSYPSFWQADGRFGKLGGVPLRYSSGAQFFQVATTGVPTDTIDDVVQQIVSQPLQSYGATPRVSNVGEGTRLIMPSDDQPESVKGEAVAVFQLPKPVIIEHVEFGYLELKADVEHIERIAHTVRFLQPEHLVSHDLYFGNSALGAECADVVPVSRDFFKETITPEGVLQALLDGPTPPETLDGFTTSVPGNVSVQSYRLQGAAAYVDFTDQLQQGVAGSCTVEAIRAQITQTLTQFPEIDAVVISINDLTEGILQP